MEKSFFPILVALIIPIAAAAIQAIIQTLIRYWLEKRTTKINRWFISIFISFVLAILVIIVTTYSLLPIREKIIKIDKIDEENNTVMGKVRNIDIYSVILYVEKKDDPGYLNLYSPYEEAIILIDNKFNKWQIKLDENPNDYLGLYFFVVNQDFPRPIRISKNYVSKYIRAVAQTVWKPEFLRN